MKISSLLRGATPATSNEERDIVNGFSKPFQFLDIVS